MEQCRKGTRWASGPWWAYPATATATAAAAVAGSVAVDADSPWYRALAKPRWQPPPHVFGLVWTPLYVSLAWATGRALSGARRPDRRALATAVGVNLITNGAWTWFFFRRQSPPAGLLATLALDVSNVVLIRRVAGADRTAAAALLPYAAWCAFATALNADIAWRNRG
ncbi:TspO/MBR family protein [Streptomyces sp. NPDC059176]|uniref:TspO/MBR family protein n=1 Tax=Streptomyces sp. NPDC059176 TaxID=3346758 RepID=UPI0036B508D9